MTKKEFYRLLLSGHGRAAKVILERGADDYERVIWRAINADRAPKVTLPGAEYYAKLILALKNPDPMIRRVMRSIPKDHWHVHRWLLEHIVIELALRGQKDCRAYVFRNWKVGLPEGSTSRLFAYLELRKSAGVPHVIAEVKRLVRGSQSVEKIAHLPGLLKCFTTEEKWSNLLQTAIDDCPQLADWAQWRMPTPAKPSGRSAPLTSYDAVLEAMEDEFFMWLFPQFGLPPEDLERLRDGALNAKDNRERERFVFPFSQQPWPGDPTPLVKWATGDDEWLRKRAVAALAVVDPGLLRQAAYELLQTEPTERRRIAELFNLSCLPEDEATLIALRNAAETSDERYSIETEWFDLLRLGRPGFSALRRDVYATSESDDRRGLAVAGMIRSGEISDELLEECLHDSDHVTRDIAKKALRARRKARAKA